jgi:hypothetical protein
VLRLGNGARGSISVEWMRRRGLERWRSMWILITEKNSVVQRVNIKMQNIDRIFLHMNTTQ